MRIRVGQFFSQMRLWFSNFRDHFRNFLPWDLGPKVYLEFWSPSNSLAHRSHFEAFWPFYKRDPLQRPKKSEILCDLAKEELTHPNAHACIPHIILCIYVRLHVFSIHMYTVQPFFIASHSIGCGKNRLLVFLHINNKSTVIVLSRRQ